MKKTKALVNRLLEEVGKHGIIQSACDKHGISRQTFYRWMKDYPDFLKEVTEAQSLGVGVVNDVALSNILAGIKSKDMNSTKYWLSHRHPEFRRPFVHRVDIDDLIAYERSITEGMKKHELIKEIEKKEKSMTEEEKQEKIKEVMAFQDRWKRQIERGDEERAQKLFEKWKEEYEKGRKKPPKNT
jgi:ACT domain-containing protein